MTGSNVLNSDYVLRRTEKDKKRFEKSFGKYQEWFLCNIWLFNVLECKDSSHGYIVYKSTFKQKKYPSTNEFKMSLTMQQLFEYYSKRSVYLTEENILHITAYKIVYFYLIQPKRLLGIDFYAICRSILLKKP